MPSIPVLLACALGAALLTAACAFIGAVIATPDDDEYEERTLDDGRTLLSFSPQLTAEQVERLKAEWVERHGRTP